jgi:hypothetical protein
LEDCCNRGRQSGKPGEVASFSGKGSDGRSHLTERPSKDNLYPPETEAIKGQFAPTTERGHQGQVASTADMCLVIAVRVQLEERGRLGHPRSERREDPVDDSKQFLTSFLAHTILAQLESLMFLARSGLSALFALRSSGSGGFLALPFRDSWTDPVHWSWQHLALAHPGRSQL